MQVDFQALFSASPNPYVVLDPALAIVWMNDAYLAATSRQRGDILGRSMFEAFPSDPSSESYRLLKSSFDRVLASGQVDEIALIRYDIANADGGMDVRFWSATHTPLLDAHGKVALILQHTVDVTELHNLRAMRDAIGVVQRAQAVQTRNQDLLEESERLRDLFEQAPGFVAVLSGTDYRFQMTNAAYRSLVGNRDLAGLPLAEALPEVVEQGFFDLLDQVRCSAKPYIGHREQLILANENDESGLKRYLDFVYQPILADDGQVSGIFVQGHDVTAQVRAEEHQSLLISELNHRVKNTLAIIQGLATQSFRRAASLEEARSTFTARLMTLARAHDLLTKNSRETAGIAETILSEVEATAGADAERVSVRGPAFHLGPQAAMSLAMIVHELSTNAIKYGALSVEQGRVDVSWTSTRVDDAVEIVLDWQESGGPSVSEPVRRGFGSRLVQRGIASDFKSEVMLRFDPRGLFCRFVTRHAVEASEPVAAVQ